MESWEILEKLFIKLKKVESENESNYSSGNHDLWIHEKDIDSISKIERINKLM